MKRTATVRKLEADADKPERRAARLRPVPTPAPRPALFTAQIHEITSDGPVLAIGTSTANAKLDASVHPTVIAGAHARRERVLVEEGTDGALVIVGALRTQPTPGIDEGETYTIKAQQIALEAGKELSLTTQTAA